MKWAAIILAVLFASVLVTLTLYEDNGYVLLSFGHWSVETSLVMFVLALLIVLSATVLLWRMLRGTWKLPAQWLEGRRDRRRERGRDALPDGLLQMARGEWRRAEKRLLAYTDHVEGTPAYYLCAARSAQQQPGGSARRDLYLRQAYEQAVSDKVRLAVLLTQAQLQMEAGQYEQALATLNSLRDSAVENALVLDLQRQAYLAVRDWDNLRALLPRLRRRRVLSPAATDALALEIYQRLMRAAAERNDADAVQALYGELPRHLRNTPQMALCHVDCLSVMGDDAAAVESIRQWMRKQWDEQLVLRFGLLQSEDAAGQLAVAQGWLRKHGEQPVALLTVGRLCMRNRLWGKARHYLEAAVRRGPRPDAYRELGRLLFQLGEHDAAGEAFSSGLNLALQTGESD